MEKKKKTADDIINESIARRNKKKIKPVLEIWSNEKLIYGDKEYYLTDLKSTDIINDVLVLSFNNAKSILIDENEMSTTDMIEIQSLIRSYIEPQIPIKKKEESMYDYIASGADHRAVIFLKEMLKSRKTRMSPEEAIQLEEHYNQTFGLNEKIAGCDICAVRMWKRLANHFHIK